MYLKIKQFGNGKPILFGLNQMRAPFSVVMKEEDVLVNAEGRKLIPEGSFLVGIDDRVRFLPRTQVKGTFNSNADGTATNAATLTLRPPSFAFKTGDVLYAQAGHATLVFSGTSGAGDVYTVRINGVSYSATGASSDTAGVVAGKWITANTAALAAAGVRVTQKGSTESVVIYAKDSYKIDTFTSNGATSIRVVTTDPGFLGDSIVPLGTISSIAAANSSGERVVTLAANAAYVVPADTPVGVEVDKYLGIYPDPLDFSEDPLVHIAPIVEADGVYQQNLPYCDEQLRRVFDDLRINKRFYRAV